MLQSKVQAYTNFKLRNARQERRVFEQLEEKEANPQRRRVVAIMAAAGVVLVAVLCVIGMFYSPMKHDEASAYPAAVPQPVQNANQTTEPLAVPDSHPPTIPPTPSDEESNADTSNSASCYGYPPFESVVPMTATDRREFAASAGTSLDEKAPNTFTVRTTGEDDRHLVIAVTPEHEGALKDFAANLRANEQMVSTICVKQFADVRFVVFDQNMRPTLIAKIQPDPEKAFAFISTKGGAEQPAQ